MVWGETLMSSSIKVSDDGTLEHICKEGGRPAYSVIKKPSEPHWVLFLNRDWEIYCNFCYNCGAKL